MGDQTAGSSAYVVQLLVPQRAMLDILVAGLLRLRVLTRLLLSILAIAHIAIPRSNIRIIDPTKHCERYPRSVSRLFQEVGKGFRDHGSRLFGLPNGAL
jgi:hypothetical protein